MSQNEITSSRESDLWYSRWHRFPTLPQDCYQMNIDFIEYRRTADGTLKIVGIFEIAKKSESQSLTEQLNDKEHSGEISILWQLAQGMNVPAFIVLYDNYMENKKFYVYQLNGSSLNDVQFRNKMYEEEYKQFIKEL